MLRQRKSCAGRRSSRAVSGDPYSPVYKRVHALIEEALAIDEIVAKPNFYHLMHDRLKSKW